MMNRSTPAAMHAPGCRALHPAPLRLNRQGVRGWGAILALALTAVAALVLWAAFSTIQETARARGQVVSAARTQVIQAVDAGVLATLPVKEGDHIARGDVVATLDRTRVAASYEEAKSKTMALRAALTRLRAEVALATPRFDPEFREWPEFVRNQMELYQRRKTGLADATAALESTLHLVDEELRLTQPLEVSGDVGHTEILKLFRQRAELRGQIVNLKNKFLQDAQPEMTKTAEELSSQEKILTERRALLDHTEIKAPLDGIVKNIAVTTLGATVKPGDMLMELVPVGSELIVEAKLSPADVAFVHPGLRATVKFDTFDYTIFGEAGGIVSYVSPDALSESDPRAGDHVFYKLRIHIMSLPPRTVGNVIMEMQPGMTAQVEVRTGERTVLQYMLKPLLKTFSEALGER